MLLAGEDRHNTRKAIRAARERSALLPPISPVSINGTDMLCTTYPFDCYSQASSKDAERIGCRVLKPARIEGRWRRKVLTPMEAASLLKAM